jgi:hypothetical protein
MPASSAGSSASSPLRASSFRIEREPAGRCGRHRVSLSDLELASRLSFFLWSSIPDEELRAAAGARHAERSGSPGAAGPTHASRSAVERLVDNFASRWLELSKIPGVVPDTELYPEFDENLRDAMDQETRLFVGSQVHGNRACWSC